MKKSSYLLGMLALGLLSLSSAGGCSSEDPAPANTGGSASGAGGGAAAGTAGMGTAGTAGAGTAGAGTAGASTGPKMTGTMLNGAAAYTILMGADAMPGATPAPPAYTGSACASCHGSAGQGVAQLGPEIRHTPTVYSTYVVRNGRPSPSLMAAFDEESLASTGLTEIQAWLAGQPKPTTGQGLYLDFCANCHGPTGGGGSVPVKASGLPTTTINSVVRAGAGSDPGQRGLYMPAFGPDVLTEGELSMIAQFLGGT